MEVLLAEPRLARLQAAHNCQHYDSETMHCHSMFHEESQHPARLARALRRAVPRMA